MSDTNIRVERADGIYHASIGLHAIDHDPRLSWKAKGILAYMLTRPREWTLRRSDIINRATDGRESVTRGIKELRDAGYVRIVGVSGGGRRWLLSETPKTEAEWLEIINRRESTTSTKDGKPVLRDESKDGKPVLRDDSERRKTGFPSDGFSAPLEENRDRENNKPSVGLPLGEKHSKKTKRAHALPSGWSPTKEHLARAMNDGTNVEAECEKFRSYHLAKGTTFKDWNAAFTGWLIRAEEYRSRDREKEEREEASATRTFWG